MNNKMFKSFKKNSPGRIEARKNLHGKLGKDNVITAGTISHGRTLDIVDAEKARKNLVKSNKRNKRKGYKVNARTASKI